VGTAAFNTGQNILYLSLSLLLSSLLLSGILSWMNFKGCRWRLETGRHFRVGEPSPVYLELHNTKKRLPSYSLTFRVLARLSGLRQELVLDERLDPGKRIRLLWEFSPLKRGPEILSLEGLLSRYPFGFLKKSIRDSFEKEIIVWPPRIPYQFSGDKSGRRMLYGRHHRKGEGIDLLHLREYRSGDPIKRIHWKATARMGSLQVRETEQEHHQAFVLYVDPSPSLWLDDTVFDKMCSMVTSLAEDLYQQDRLKGGQIAGEAMIPISAIEDLYTFLDRLGAITRTSPKPGSVSRPDHPFDTIHFSAGVGRTILAQTEEGTIGQA